MAKPKLPLPSALELAHLAAAAGPVDAPLQAIRNAMKLYLRALKDRKRMADMDDAELVFHYGDEEARRELDEWNESRQPRFYPGRESDEVREILRKEGFRWKRAKTWVQKFALWRRKYPKTPFDEWWNSLRRENEKGEEYFVIADELIWYLTQFLKNRKLIEVRNRVAGHRRRQKEGKKKMTVTR